MKSINCKIEGLFQTIEKDALVRILIGRGEKDRIYAEMSLEQRFCWILYQAIRRARDSVNPPHDGHVDNNSDP